MKRYLLLFCMAFTILLSGASVSAQNGQILETGSIVVKQQYQNKMVSGGNLLVYQIALREQHSDSLEYVLKPEFKNTASSVLEADLKQFHLEDIKGLLQVAQSVTPYVTIETIPLQGAQLNELPQGVYLLVQTVPADGYEKLTPFLIAVPNQGQLLVETIQKMSIKKDSDSQQQMVIPDDSKRKDKELPFTGQIWWPVPVLLITGVLLLLVSVSIRGDQDETS
ncbi:hypothetical protein [Streptococcus moroccensis]|uniref:Gram-positive pilin subunit D1 N-terminal domain-containing protein n=1 Tax=Streptococcus moroccensis TaxID=1451356 RepID=A0ABT9YUH7_9STRE|nr:hypothetical protein [Streptococcus moroccensis]MDQ0223425.1 hypothetical protein [Streptococcus moroccensis]